MPRKDRSCGSQRRAQRHLSASLPSFHGGQRDDLRMNWATPLTGISSGIRRDDPAFLPSCLREPL